MHTSLKDKHIKDFDARKIPIGCALDYEKNGPRVSIETSMAVLSIKFIY